MAKKLSMQDIILTLQQFWAKQGCMIMQSYDTEKGAGVHIHFYGQSDQNHGTLRTLNHHAGRLMDGMVKTRTGYINTTNSKF